VAQALGLSLEAVWSASSSPDRRAGKGVEAETARLALTREVRRWRGRSTCRFWLLSGGTTGEGGTRRPHRGGSLIRGLASTLEQTLGLPVRSLMELEPGGLLGQLGEGGREAPVYAVAGGLVLGGSTAVAGSTSSGKGRRPSIS